MKLGRLKLKLFKIQTKPIKLFRKNLSLVLFDNSFLEKKIKIKNKDLQSPTIIRGIKRSSKCNQSLYEKFLKNPNKQNELECKSYKHLFESVKKRSKKLNSSKVILTNKNNIRKTLKIIKEHRTQKIQS